MTAAIIHQSLTLVHIIFNIGNKKNTKKGLLINYFFFVTRNFNNKDNK